MRTHSLGCHSTLADITYGAWMRFLLNRLAERRNVWNSIKLDSMFTLEQLVFRCKHRKFSVD